MRFLHVTCSMNPAQGGLSACIRALVPALAALGHESEIVCLDAPAEPFLKEIPAAIHALGPARFGYAYSAPLRSWLQAASSRFDAVIVHGLWQYHGLATHAALKRPGSPPYFVFSHGMLDPWFKRQYPLKHVKKWFYWWLAERRILRGAAAVLFTCEEEKRLARLSFAGSSYRERVVTFGTDAPPEDSAAQAEAFLQLQPGLRGRPYWLFLGRIHPKKGPGLLIEAYASLAVREPNPPCLVMAGPCEDAVYLNQLQERAAASCPAGTVFWPGMLTGKTKWGALRSAEIFILPSHQENFGIAVVEALACETPVLISNQVNIWREILADGAGLIAPDTSEGTLEIMYAWLALRPEKRRAMRVAARRCFQQRYEIGAAANSLVNVVREFLPASPSPRKASPGDQAITPYPNSASPGMFKNGL